MWSLAMTRTSIDWRMVNPHQEGMNMTQYARIKRNHGRTVWFDPEVLVKVEVEARKKGKGFSTLVYEIVRREILPKSRNL